MFSFLFSIFPLQLKRSSLFFFIAIAFLSTALLCAFLYTRLNTDTVYLLYGENQVTQFTYMYDAEHIKLTEQSSQATTRQFLFYIFNNCWIAIKIFLGGLLFGLGSLTLLIYNGLSMGALMGYLVANGYGSTLWPTVIGHSVFELMATVISATAGFKVGWSIIGPVKNNLPRLQHIILEFKQSLLLMYGAIALIIIAAFIEAFWSSNNNISDTLKYISGCVFWIILPVYFWVAVRTQSTNL